MFLKNTNITTYRFGGEIMQEEIYKEEQLQEEPLYEEEEWNVYNKDVIEELTEDDELDPYEEAFMLGYLEESTL